MEFITEIPEKELTTIRTLHIRFAHKYSVLYRTMLYNMVRFYKPKIIVELGTGNGICTTTMALALKKNRLDGKIYTYDLFDNIGEENFGGDINSIKTVFKDYKIDKYIKMKQMNAWDWLENPFDFDMMHIDINNTNEILDKIFSLPFMKQKIQEKKIILHEGSCRLKRDNCFYLTEERVGLTLLRNNNYEK